MRRILVLATTLALMLLAVPIASAAPKGVVITGGSTTFIPDAPGSSDGFHRTVGFNAHQNRDGSWKGQVQVKDLSTNGTLLGQFHGSVVCAQETTTVADSQGWEIRFDAVNGKGVFGFLAGNNQSLFVQDDPGGDQIDLVLGFGGDTLCGLNDGAASWDPVTNGQIKVHD